MGEKYFRNPRIIDRLEPNGEYYLFDPITARFRRLNNVGSDVWNLLEEHHEVHGVAELLLTRYRGADLEKVCTDVAQLMSKLVEADLVEVRAE